jgi:protein TonB
MKNQAMFQPSTFLSDRDALLITLFVAIIVHAVVILGVSFTAPQPETMSKAIDITLVNTPAKKAPKEAKFLAQKNQIGAGEENRKPELLPQKLRSSKGNHFKQIQKKAPPQESRHQAAQKVITRLKAEQKVVAANKPDTPHKSEAQSHLTAESLHQQITQYGTEIRLSQQSADNSKIKFVNMASARQYSAAQYLTDWENKVERTGENNYPAVAAKKNFFGALTMDVGIKPDGSIYSIRINKSSGNQALDEAAKRIVKMSAPFAPLPLELLKELNLKQQDVFVITRIWKFSDESGMTTQ